MAFLNGALKEENIECFSDEKDFKRQSVIEKTYSPLLVWEGTEEDTECEKFKHYVEKKYKRNFISDKDFHEWSINNFEDYWETVWKYFDVIASIPYKKVFKKTGPGFLDNDWFTEARLNFAENILRNRDDSIAIIYKDEDGNEDTITFARLFEEVRKYAAAFRKSGLVKGDRVACNMSNRTEAVYAMLATLSIGAIFGGSIPYFGAQAAANIVGRMEPKILIAVDRFQENEKEYDIFSCLPTIVKNAPTLEKVIIVPSRKTTLSMDISHVKNSCFLHDFLKSGIGEDGTVPELEFEQVPASHPIFLSFTSGTTGIPKGTVHFTWALLHALSCMSNSCDIQKGDVMFSNSPVGWIPILVFIATLALGGKLYLYNGGFYFKKNSFNIWNIFSEGKVKIVLLAPSQLEMMEKLEIVPKPGLCLESLRMVIISGNPVKVQNVDFLNKYLSKRTFASSLYGSTEFFGFGSWFYLKSPSYAGEAQLPALGVDIQCYNDEGKPVFGELGTLVVATPTPSLPPCLWKDTDRSIITSNYLAMFPGVWCQNDNGWINPVTHGILVRGRSDDTFIQDGDTFGPEDIYFSIHDIDELEDYICAAQNREDGDERVVLFVKMKKGCEFTHSVRTKIEQKIEAELFEDCVPKVILSIKDIPYSMTNKRVERVVRKIMADNKIPDNINIKNPECLKYYCNIPEVMNYYKL